MPPSLSASPTREELEESRTAELKLLKSSVARAPRARPFRLPRIPRRHRTLWAAIAFAALFTTAFLLVMDVLFAERTQIRDESRAAYPRVD